MLLLLLLLLLLFALDEGPGCRNDADEIGDEEDKEEEGIGVSGAYISAAVTERFLSRRFSRPRTTATTVKLRTSLGVRVRTSAGGCVSITISKSP